MIPEERARNVLELSGVPYSAMEDVIADEIREAVEEERLAWEAKHHHVLKYHVVGADNAGMCRRCNLNELDWSTWSRQAGGKEKFCGCGRPSKDPVIGGCGEC